MHRSHPFFHVFSFTRLQYAAKEFGTCPLAQCSGQPVLPVGVKDEMGADTVKIFCPKCQCVYHPPPMRSRSSSHHGAGAAGVDGAAFGTTFPHLFLMTFSNLVPDPLPPNSAYIPRVFGFRVHMSARQRTSSNTAAASGDQLGKSSKQSSRAAYSRKTSSQGGNSRSSREKDKSNAPAAAAVSSSTKPAAAAAAPVYNATNAVAAAAVNANTAVTDGIKQETAQEAAAGNKRRADGSIPVVAAAANGTPKKEGNGLLVDSAGAKRRKA